MRPTVSYEAKRWIQGEIRSSDYFASARQEAVARARTDVIARLSLNNNALLGPRGSTVHYALSADPRP